MKKLPVILSVFIAVICMLLACNKNGEPDAPKGEIAVTKLKIKINEPDSMMLVGADTNKVVSWAINPAGFDTLHTFKNAAQIKFNKAGKYTISAKNNDVTSKSITITVIDSVYVPPISFIYFDTSEEITVVPRYVKSTTSDSSYIAYTATTKNKYCNNYQLSGGGYYDDYAGAYYLGYDGVLLKVPVAECTSTTVLSQKNDYRSYQRKLTPGIYQFHGTVGDGIGRFGSGTIEITDTKIIFHWDDSHGMIISPKELTR